MTIELTICELLSSLHVEILEVQGIAVQPANDYVQDYCQRVIARASQRWDLLAWQAECQEIRQLLRHGKFKASGRSKPSQEYLATCVARDGALPRINGPVDLLNAVSLDYNLPMSLLSLDKCSHRFYLARGQEGEKYVFNSAGQVLDLCDLITVYDASGETLRPVGSPVKDSLAGKITAADRNMVVIIYSPDSETARDRAWRAIEELRSGFATMRNAN